MALILAGIPAPRNGKPRGAKDDDNRFRASK
jgi:hypothetical protein